MNNRALLTTGLIAGVIAGVLSSIPLINFVNCLLCGWLWLAGMFAVWFYKRSNPGMVTSGQGATLGAVTGLVAAIIAWLVSLLIGGAGFASALASQAGQYGETGDQIISLLAGGLGSVISLFFYLIFFTLFGAIGGLIGAAVFGKPSTPTYPPASYPPSNPPGM